MLSDLLQVLGALLVLGAFVMLQLQLVSSTSRMYLGMNAIGAGTLATLAFLGSLWGFFLLEGAWAVVSIVALSRRWTRASREPM